MSSETPNTPGANAAQPIPPGGDPNSPSPSENALPPSSAEAAPPSSAEAALPPSSAEAALPPSAPPPTALPAPAATPAQPPPSARFPAKPEQLPEPTYWPFFMGLGIAFIGWGLISFWLVSIGGLIVFAIALRGWINNLHHEK